MQQTDQLANDILHDSLIAIVTDAQNRYPPLTCGGYIHIRTRQAEQSSYNGIEEILQALSKAQVRLNANVNFDLVIELLLLTIKEN